MDFWIKAAQLILSLSLLVVLHEFGHYIPARIFKTRVEKFYLFFNWKFSLFKKKIGETEWGIGWIPLGGYVKIAGMIDESMDKEQMAKPPQPWEFRSKPAWQRLIIMIGGVVVNVIVGILIYIFVLFAWGEEQAPAKDLQHGMAIHPYLEQYGIFSGDKIIEIEGEAVMNPNDITLGLLIRDQHKLTVEHKDGTIEKITLPDDIAYKLFEEGATPVASIRMLNKPILGVTTTMDSKKGMFEAGDLILTVDGKDISQIDFSNAALKSKKHKVKVARDEDTVLVKADPKEFQSLLRVAPAMTAGLRPNDDIVAVNDRKIEYYDDIQSELYNSKNKNVTLTVYRNEDTLEIKSYVNKMGTLGFLSNRKMCSDTNVIFTQHYGFGESIGKGFSKGYTTLNDYAGQLKFLFTKKGASSMGGFGAIGGLFPSQWDWQKFWLNTAFISIILAFMNILPIPALDGGHVVFLLYEMITGKEAPEKVLEIAQYIGFFLIIGLVLYANGNDIYRWLAG